MKYFVYILIASSLCAMPCFAANYGVARTDAPVLNTPDLPDVFGGANNGKLLTDRCGQVRQMEFMAFAGTAFRILSETKRAGQLIYRVETDEYTAAPGVSLYVDSRFIATQGVPPSPRARRLPSREQIISFMKGGVGDRYVWGGNVQKGVEELIRYYGNNAADDDAIKKFTLAGFDCSGLLYQATNGWTPRNTSDLVRYGKGVQVAGKNPGQISQMLRPLDLIVWNGHVLIVLDQNNVIESRLECGKPRNGGVVVSPLKKKLEGIMEKRLPADAWPAGRGKRDLFVIRRWYEQSN